MVEGAEPAGQEPERAAPGPQEPVRVVGGAALVEADPSAGMVRRRAFEAGGGSCGLWCGLVHTEPGAVSGWHHHGDHHSSLFVMSGAIRLEYGPGGRSTVEAGPGDFVHVPAYTVHREANPADETATLVVTRAGSGPPTVNVSGPQPDA